MGNHSQQASGNNQPICSLDKLEPEKLGSISHASPRIWKMCFSPFCMWATLAQRRNNEKHVLRSLNKPFLCNAGAWCIKSYVWKRSVEFHILLENVQFGFGRVWHNFESYRLRDPASWSRGWVYKTLKSNLCWTLYVSKLIIYHCLLIGGNFS